MEKRMLICIGCPLGCQLEVTLENGKFQSVTGNTCKNGAKYAEKEVTDPRRIVTTTVAVEASTEGIRMVPCKTAQDVPKGKIFDVMRDAAAIRARAPIHIGDVLKANAGNTGIPLVATKNVN